MSTAITEKFNISNVVKLVLDKTGYDESKVAVRQEIFMGGHSIPDDPSTSIYCWYADLVVLNDKEMQLNICRITRKGRVVWRIQVDVCKLEGNIVNLDELQEEFKRCLDASRYSYEYYQVPMNKRCLTPGFVYIRPESEDNIEDIVATAIAEITKCVVEELAPKIQ